MASSTTYGRVDKFLHWLIALNITATLIAAFGMSDLDALHKIEEYGDHGASVTTILICMTLRVLWRLKNGFPPLPGSMSDIQKLMAKVMHYGLYIVIFAQLMLGILLASTTEQDFIAKGYNINYSAFDLLANTNYELVLSLHITLYWVIIAMLTAHIGAALKHHFIDKDSVLKGMLPGKG
ncbi:MAG: cytochrome b [Bermanella sp.]